MTTEAPVKPTKKTPKKKDKPQTKAPDTKTSEPKTDSKAKKTSKIGSAWNRLTSAPFLHWAAEARGAAKSPIRIRSIKATSTTIDEGAQLSLAVDLLHGNGPKELQALFNKEVSNLRAEFDKVFPNYSYKIGGINPKK